MNDYEKVYHEGHKQYEGKEAMNKTLDAVLHLRALGPLRGDFSDSTTTLWRVLQRIPSLPKSKIEMWGIERWQHFGCSAKSKERSEPQNIEGLFS